MIDTTEGLNIKLIVRHIMYQRSTFHKARWRMHDARGVRGVSDVIANVLLLSIIMTLFTSIFFWVVSMPPPIQKTVINVSMEFTGPIYVGPNNYVYYLNLTHEGGEILQNFSTIISLRYRDGSPIARPVFYLTDSSPRFSSWNSGSTLRFSWTDTIDKDELVVTIIDHLKNLVVWQSTIKAQEKNRPPQIIDWSTDPAPAAPGTEFRFMAKIIDPNIKSSWALDFNRIYANFDNISTAIGTVQLTHTSNNVFISGLLMVPSNIPLGTYYVIVNATDNGNLMTTVVLPIEINIGEGRPNLIITSADIKFSNDAPSRGEDLTITVTIHNKGSLGAQSSNITFWSNYSNNITFLGYVNNVSVAAYGETTVSLLWTNVRPSGLHLINVTIKDVVPSGHGGNASRELIILPKILLVDDDSAITGTALDATSFFRSALLSSNFKYDLFVVPALGNGPAYSGGANALEKYDVVIWVSGLQSNVLTIDDITNLRTFLTNGGKLWLSGLNILLDNGTALRTFLGIASVDNVINTPLSVVGVYPGGDYVDLSMINPVEVQQRVSGTWGYRKISPIANQAQNLLVTNDSNQFTIASQYQSSTYKTVAFTFEFGNIRDTGLQGVIVYRVINWFTGITKHTGEDLAVSYQEIIPNAAKYMEPVQIKITVRNNGALNESTAVWFYIDGSRMLNRDGTYVELKNITLNAYGDSKQYTVVWYPYVVGTHTIVAKIDPENNIEETDENNNEFFSDIISNKIYVQYSILVVDDDNSPNNGGPSSFLNSTKYITEVLDYLNASYEVDIVQSGQSRNAILRSLLNYSAVLWVTGNTSSNTLTGFDRMDIEDYLQQSGELGAVLIIGPRVLDDSSVQGDITFLNMFGVGGILSDPWWITSNEVTVYGVLGDDITNGMKLTFNSSIFRNVYVSNAFSIAPGATGTIRTSSSSYWAYDVSKGFIGSRYYHPSYKWRTSFLSFDLAYMNDFSERAELLYLTLHWFSWLVNKTEARITTPDIYFGSQYSSVIGFPNMNPVLGKSYVMRANITNYGMKSADVVIRFLDGNTVIDSRNVHLESSRATSTGIKYFKTTVEIIWTPLFAGLENISVVIDPDNVIGTQQYFRFNDRAGYSLQVYFFYDDFENPRETFANWNHEATILRINGDNPIEYFDPPASDMKTNVIYQWDETRSKGFKLQNNSYHTAKNAFSMVEFFRGPIDVVLMIDTSNSMQPTGPSSTTDPIDKAVRAAKYLVENLSDDSRVAIFTYCNTPACGSNFGYKYGNLPFTTLDCAGRTKIYNKLTDIESTANYVRGFTPLWDAIGYSVKYGNHYGRKDKTAIVVLSDGVDLQGSDTQATYQPQWFEAGSDEYAPWTAWGAPTTTFDRHIGKYPNGSASRMQPGTWRNLDLSPAQIESRTGLLYIYNNTPTRVRVFTIGLMLEHHEPPNQPQVSSLSFPRSDLNAVYTGPASNESGTTEYNLWRIATTANGKYYYAATPDDLINVFEQIGQDLGGGATLLNTKYEIRNTKYDSRPTTHDLRPTTYDQQLTPYVVCPPPSEGTPPMNYLTTPPLDFRGVSEATLTFWHKYNLKLGSNIAVILFGANFSGSYKYKYVVPTQRYTGNVNTSMYLYDSFNTRILFGWNGVSAGGTFDWEYVEVKLDLNDPDFATANKEDYRIRFAYYYAEGFAQSGGWFIDDVEIKVSRSDFDAPSSMVKDMWELSTRDKHSGSRSYWLRDPGKTTEDLPDGVDTSLVTAPIDLTRAKNATLIAYFKFNIKYPIGRPPDGFRIEVSADNGISWKAVNLGVRSAWNVSGTDTTCVTTNPCKKYTGVNEGNYWVSTLTMYRVNADLSGWSGNVILLRIRVVTNMTAPHYHVNPSSVGFGGLFVDDVKIVGDTIIKGMTNDELRDTKYEIRNTKYEIRVSNDELRVTNEELRVTNEEIEHKGVVNNQWSVVSERNIAGNAGKEDSGENHFELWSLEFGVWTPLFFGIALFPLNGVALTVKKRAKAIRPEIWKTVNEMSLRLKKEYKAEKVILYGSYARGEETEESDIDLLIIAPTNEKFFKRMATIKKILRDLRFGLVVSPIVLTREEIKKRVEIGDQFIQSILEEGVEI